MDTVWLINRDFIRIRTILFANWIHFAILWVSKQPVAVRPRIGVNDDRKNPAFPERALGRTPHHTRRLAGCRPAPPGNHVGSTAPHSRLRRNSSTTCCRGFSARSGPLEYRSRGRRCWFHRWASQHGCRQRLTSWSPPILGEGDWLRDSGRPRRDQPRERTGSRSTSADTGRNLRFGTRLLPRTRWLDALAVERSGRSRNQRDRWRWCSARCR